MKRTMNQLLNKYKKSAYLSFQLILYYKHLQINDTNIVLSLDAKHIKDLNYQPITITVPKDIDFNKTLHISFMHILKHFKEYSTYALPTSFKKKKRVTFNEDVKVILIEHQVEYDEHLTQ